MVLRSSSGVRGRGRSVLRHPVWWAALGVLLLNDHVLKGSVWVPKWATGKLSDIAGLIVAPVLASVLLGKSRCRTAAAFALVAIPFAAINLSSSAAESVERLLGTLGLPWRIWCDPTDLVALAALPAAWWIVRSAAGKPAEQVKAAGDSPRHPQLHDRLAFLLGAAACLAISVDYESLWTAVYITNVTHDDIQLQVFRGPPLDCTTASGDPAGRVPLEQFVLEACQTLEPFKPLPLDQNPYYPDDDASRPPPGPVCDAVVLRSAGLQDTLVFWNDVEQRKIDASSDSGCEGPGSLCVEGVGGQLVIGRSPFIMEMS